jgi:hypothetical protein
VTDAQALDKFLSTFAFLRDFRDGHTWTEVAISLASAGAIPALLALWYRGMNRLYGRR